MASPSEPLLDARDIQGNVIPGFRRKKQLFVGYALGPDPDALPRALAAVAPAVTALPEVLDHRDERKAAMLAGLAPPSRADLWLNVALGRATIDRLGLTKVASLDAGFAAGIQARAGDPANPTNADGSPNPSKFTNWRVGSPTAPLDLLLIFAGDGEVGSDAAALMGAVSATGMRKVYEELGQLLPDDAEHFGFQDGISVPGVAGEVEIDGVRRPITTRYGVPDRDGFSFGKPGQPIADADQFLIDPTGAADAGDLRHGSFLVFRRLRQDVRAFYADTDGMAADLSAGTGSAVSGAELRARIVGRWPSGQPLIRPAQAGNAAEDPLALNYFAFREASPALRLANGACVPAADGDPNPMLGLRCPLFAHIRKVNPRDMGTDKGGAAETLGFQMLRRGIPFGPAYDHADPGAPTNREERGLLFVAYQRSTSAFETLNSQWMNRDKAPSGNSGDDLLVGQHLSDQSRHAPKQADLYEAAGNPLIRLTAPNQWVIPTGGAYLFAPSVSLINKLAAAVVPIA